jgi:uncharacterized membrane-anchored protein
MQKKIKKNNLVFLSAVLILVVLVITSFFLYNQWPLIVGEKVLLATEPVDPFDPLLGQYIQINYEISRLNNSGNFFEGDKVCVLLEKDSEDIFRPIQVSSNFNEGTFICGEVVSSFSSQIRIEYGIERYYFERNKKFPSQNITVEAKVTSLGRAKISEIFYNDKPIDLNNLK